MLNNLLKSDKYLRHGRITEMLKVTQNSSPDMSVHINQGTTIFNNKIINIEDQLSADLAAPDVGNWIVVISVNTNGQLVYTYGVQSTDIQSFPALPDECIHLAAISIGAADTYITNDNIYDLRTIFTYSKEENKTCQLKCTSDIQTLTEDERNMIIDYSNKYEVLAQELDKLKLELQPKKEYHVLSDSGLEYSVKFNDNGEMYTTRVGFDIDNNITSDTVVQNYKFTFADAQLNCVTLNNEQYVPIPIKIRSFDANNDEIMSTLIINCIDTTIYSENFEPQYMQDEFIISNLKLTKSGFSERFAVQFHNAGKHILKCTLYNNNTQEIIDTASVLINLSFSED